MLRIRDPITEIEMTDAQNPTTRAKCSLILRATVMSSFSLLCIIGAWRLYPSARESEIIGNATHDPYKPRCTPSGCGALDRRMDEEIHWPAAAVATDSPTTQRQ